MSLRAHVGTIAAAEQAGASSVGRHMGGAQKQILASRPPRLLGADRDSYDVDPTFRTTQFVLDCVEHETTLYVWADLLLGIDELAALAMQRMAPATPAAVLPYSLTEAVGAPPAGASKGGGGSSGARRGLLFVGCENEPNLPHMGTASS